jgi:ATP-dependent DNA helicase RecQ
MHTPESILKTTFGYDTFKPLQREIIANVQARRDTLVIMPTAAASRLRIRCPRCFLMG